MENNPIVVEEYKKGKEKCPAIPCRAGDEY